MTVLMVVLWNVVANLPGQYFNAYVLEDLQFSYTHINLCAATNIPLMMIAMPLWNKFVHKKGWLKALGTALGLYLLPLSVQLPDVQKYGLALSCLGHVRQPDAAGHQPMLCKPPLPENSRQQPDELHCIL